MNEGDEKMKSTVRLVALSLFILTTILFSTACDPSVMVALTNTPEPIATTTVTPFATPTVKPSPSPTATPILPPTELAFSPEEKAVLNQQIHDFLNYQGDYSEENIKQFLFPELDKFYRLGVKYINESMCEVQGWLFDYLEKDGDLLLIVGFESKDNYRFVTVLCAPTHITKLDSRCGVDLISSLVWNSFSSYSILCRTSDKDTIKQHLAKNKPFLTDFFILSSTDEAAAEAGGDALVLINRHYRENLHYIHNLISQLELNGAKLDKKLITEGKEIPQISELSEIDSLDNITLPFISGITFTVSQ